MSTARKLIDDLLGIKEATGYRAFWLSPEGEMQEYASHIQGAEKILGRGQDFDTMYDTLYRNGWVRVALETDRISVSPLLTVIPLVQKRKIREWGIEKNLPVFDDAGRLLKEFKEGRK